MFLYLFFFIYLKGSKRRLEIKLEELLRKYSGLLLILK